MTPARRRSGTVVAVGTAAFAAVALTGCGSTADDSRADHQGVCRDTRCDGHHGGHYGLLYFPIGRSYPPIGGRLAGYPGAVTAVPAGHQAVRGGAAAAGGTVPKSGVKTGGVVRGGFGSGGDGGGVGG